MLLLAAQGVACGKTLADAAAPSKATAEQLSVEHRAVAKLIPDQKVLVGAPATVLDLNDVFRDSEIAQDDAPLKIEIVRNAKPAVANAALAENILTIEWGKAGKAEIVLRVTNENTSRILDNKILATVWTPDYLKISLIVIGGLGLFLLGMKNMSEGMQAVAGNGLRRIISMATSNRLLACGVGVLVTSLIQSSSITSVMVVGFVNSGFMQLSQAVGVIMGANIGTTVTAWILVLQIGKYGLPMAGVAAFVYLFSRRDRQRYIAMTVLGLGLVFFGLELMKDGFSVVKDLPAFEAWFNRFSADNYSGVVKCMLVGTVVTAVVQSSSATTGITIGLAATGVLRFDSAAALVLGQNVGTTITAWLASLGTTTSAKRAAYFHIFFNIAGVAIFTPFFFKYLELMQAVTGVSQNSNASEIVRAIAVTHTCFNVTNTLLFLPFAKVFARVLERLVPERARKEKPHLTSLDVRMLETPVIGVEQSRIEVLRMSHGCNQMTQWLGQIVAEEHPDDALVQKSFHREKVLDTIQDEIVAFLTHLMGGNVPHNIIDEARQQLRMADEFESISDYLTTILKSHMKLHNAGLRFPSERHAELADLHAMTADYLKLISEACEYRQRDVLTEAQTQGKAITHRVKELRAKHLEAMSADAIDPMLSVAFTAQLNAYRRVRDHALNIAEALAGEK